MIPDRLKPFTKPIPVLDDGHVQLIDCMGDDLAVVDAARVSFFGHSSEHTDAENRHLIRYLMRKRHTTPFEMCELKLRVRVPMDAWRQWIRHRTANVNESSTRYASAIDSAQKVTEWRSQSTNNKQGSGGLVAEWPEDYLDNLPQWQGTDKYKSPAEYLSCQEAALQADARKVYEERLAFGVAKEQARKDLPLSTYTEAYWKMDLHNLLHFLALRLDLHAQAEIRAYANAIAEIVKVWVPWTWEAFKDYRLDALYFSRQEAIGIRTAIYLAAYKAHAYEDARAAITDLKGEMLSCAGLAGREHKELIAKLNKLIDDTGTTP